MTCALPISWRLSLDYQFSPDILGYRSYNRGMKSGGFALGTSPSNNFGYQPEQLNAYEGGLKTELFDRKLIFNTAAFYYDFKNIQFQRVDAGVVRTVNGPSAKLYGAEVELTRSEEHTSELQSLMRISYAVFCLKKKNPTQHSSTTSQILNTYIH